MTGCSLLRCQLLCSCTVLYLSLHCSWRAVINGIRLGSSRPMFYSCCHTYQPLVTQGTSPTARATIAANKCRLTISFSRCFTPLELIANRHPSIFFSVCLPSTSWNISFLPVFSWHCPLITLSRRGLCNSFRYFSHAKKFWLTLTLTSGQNCNHVTDNVQLHTQQCQKLQRVKCKTLKCVTLTLASIDISSPCLFPLWLTTFSFCLQDRQVKHTNDQHIINSTRLSFLLSNHTTTDTSCHKFSSFYDKYAVSAKMLALSYTVTSTECCLIN